MPEYQEIYLPDSKLTGRFMKKGSGDPIVYLHGVFGARIWSPFLEDLSKSYTVYAPLQPGFEDLNGLDQLDDVIDLGLYYLDLIDTLQLSQIKLIGHFLGGMASLEIASLCSHNIEKIVLISPLGFWKEDVPIQDIFIMNEEEQINSIWHDKDHSSVQYLFPEKESEIEKSNRITEEKNDFIGAAKFLWPIPDRGLNRRIYRIKTPVLLVWGEYDGIISPVYADEFSNRLKKCKKVILSNSGHLPMLDQPKILSKYVLDFFNGS